MPNVKRTEKLDKAAELLRQFPKGIRITDFAKKLGAKVSKKPFVRSTAYDYLNSLDTLGLGYYERGTAYPGKVGEKHSTALSDRPALARQLIPALRAIAEISAPKYSVSGGEEEYLSPEDMQILVKVAENYLKTDPELQRPFEDFREKNEEVAQAKKSFTDSLMNKLTQKFEKELVIEPIKESKHQSFVGRNIPSLICSHMLYGAPTDLKPDVEKIWYGDSLVAKGSHLLESIEEFIKHEIEDKSNIETIKQMEKKEDEAHKAKQKFQPEIRKLIMKIKSQNT